MTEQTQRRPGAVFVAVAFALLFGIAFLEWVRGEETPTGVILSGLAALAMIMSTLRRPSRRLNLAMWIVFAIAVAGLVWQWSAR